MAYDENLIVNPDAEDGVNDWAAVNVTVSDGSVIASDLKVKVGDSKTNIWGGWFDDIKVLLTLTDTDSTHCFNLAPSATMNQAIVSGFAIDPKDMKLIGIFKFVIAQELYDATVIGTIWAEITYDDDSQSKFIIPCVQGVSLKGRDQFNNWILEEAICLIP